MDDAGVMDAVEAPVESPVEEGPSEIPPVESPETPEAAPTEAEEAPRGEVGNKEITQALKELRVSNPKVADALRKAYFAYGQFSNHFPNLRDAQAAKNALDTVGGPEGIATLREQVQSMQFVNQAAREGDSSLIDDWADDYPSGFKTAMPYAMQRWQNLDAQGFQEAVQPHFQAFLDRSLLGQRIQEVYYALQNNNPQAAAQLLNNISGWLNAHAERAREGGPRAPSAVEERLTERENTLRQQEQALFIKSVGRETLGHQANSIEKALQPYLKGSRLGEQARNRLKATIVGDIDKALLADATFQRQVHAFVTQKDAKGTEQYVKGRLDMLIPSIVRRAYMDLYGTPPKSVKSVPPALPAPQNGQKMTLESAIKVAKKPMLSDLAKDAGYMDAYIAGKGVMARGPLKGRLVRWR